MSKTPRDLNVVNLDPQTQVVIAWSALESSHCHPSRTIIILIFTEVCGHAKPA